MAIIGIILIVQMGGLLISVGQIVTNLRRIDTTLRETQKK